MCTLVNRKLAALAKGLSTVRERTHKGLGTCMDVEVLLVVLLGTEHFATFSAREVVIERVGGFEVTAYVVFGGVHVGATRARAFVSSPVHFIRKPIQSTGLKGELRVSSRHSLARLTPQQHTFPHSKYYAFLHYSTSALHPPVTRKLAKGLQYRSFYGNIHFAVLNF